MEMEIAVRRPIEVSIHCRRCDKVIPIIHFGHGYVAACHGEVLYNNDTLPQLGRIVDVKC